VFYCAKVEISTESKVILWLKSSKFRRGYG